ncbi:hypothetical protein P3G55_13080 [Leptospira sp. 96542]|nr:hypothetical protein [Leptospira sp. 96542]
MKYILPIVFFVIIHCANGSETINENYFLAKGYFAKGDLKNASEYLYRVYNEDSNFKDTSLYLIKTEFYKGNFDKSLALCEDNIKNKKLLIPSRTFKLRMHYLKGEDHKTLINEVNELLSEDSGNLEVLLIAAEIHAKIGNLSDAILFYKRIILESSKIQQAESNLKNLIRKFNLEDDSDFYLHQQSKNFSNSYTNLNSVKNSIPQKIKDQIKGEK